jgi:hypothetical protein
MYDGWKLSSPTLLVEVEGSLFKQWVALYTLVSVWRKGEIEKHTHALARLAGPDVAWCCVAWRGETMGT